MDILDDESILRVYLGPTVGGWNCVSHLDVDPEEADDRIYEAIRFFRPYNRPFLWYVTPSTHPKDIGARLTAFGFSHMEDSPGMVAEMGDLPQDYSAPDGFKIEAVEDESGLRQYFEVWALGHKYPPHIVDPFVRLYGELGFDEGRPSRLYLGYIDGDPVATSMVMRVGDTASIWWVTVLPEARQQGLGVLMTVNPLMMAREQLGLDPGSHIKSGHYFLSMELELLIRHCLLSCRCGITLYDSGDLQTELSYSMRYMPTMHTRERFFFTSFVGFVRSALA